MHPNGHVSAAAMGIPTEPSSGDAAQIPAPAQQAAPGVDIDLVAWAQGYEDHPLADVLKAIDKYALQQVEKLASATARIETRRDAIGFLVDQGLIDEADVDLVS
jgi:hypothetical protein